MFTGGILCAVLNHWSFSIYLQQQQPGPHMVRHPSAHAMLPMCEAEEAAMQASLNAGK